ncbi:hypothetical protein A2U01_0103294 [Trifolium medium]|uniref:Uncharacterized protein n=1 Tax=Trifolium medium TaxID=97028 RepID=A0A392V6E3_9FABA|nr:hypothetical protein [Trifolium medium]
MNSLTEGIAYPLLARNLLSVGIAGLHHGSKLPLSVSPVTYGLVEATKIVPKNR